MMTNFRLALRMLVKTPVVTSVAVVSLALGIGSNAAIFSLYSQFLLRPLPVVEPERLVNLEAPGPKPGSDSCTGQGGCDEVFSYPMFRDLQREQTVFTDIVAHRGFGASVAHQGRTLDIVQGMSAWPRLVSAARRSTCRPWCSCRSRCMRGWAPAPPRAASRTAATTGSTCSPA